MKSMFHMADWLPTIVQGLAGGSEDALRDLDGINQVENNHKAQ